MPFRGKFPEKKTLSEHKQGVSVSQLLIADGVQLNVSPDYVQYTRGIMEDATLAREAKEIYKATSGNTWSTVPESGI